MSYRLNNDATITRLADNVTFPHDDREALYAEYYQWLKAGGSPEISIAPTVSELLADLAALRWQKTQTFTYDGVVTAADSAISALTATVVALQIQDPTATVTWKLGPKEFRQYTLPDLVQLGGAIRAHIQHCFDVEASASAVIDAAGTTQELDAAQALLAQDITWQVSQNKPTPEAFAAAVLAKRIEGRPGRSHYLKAAEGQITLVRDGAVVMTFDPKGGGPDADAYNVWVENGGVPV